MALRDYIKEGRQHLSSKIEIKKALFRASCLFFKKCSKISWILRILKIFSKSEMDGGYKAQFFNLVTANAYRIFKICLSMYNNCQFASNILSISSKITLKKYF